MREITSGPICTVHSLSDLRITLHVDKLCLSRSGVILSEQEW